MARPIKKIDIEQLKRLAMINCSYAEISSVMGIDVSTLTRRYAQVIKEGREQGTMSLKRKMWEMAHQGSTAMAIFLSKNLCGYSDKVETKNDTVATVVNTIAADKVSLIEAIKTARDEKFTG